MTIPPLVDVAIVGTGAVAMTAALAFKNRNVLLITKKPSPTIKKQRYFALNKNSINFLQTLDVNPHKFSVNAFHLFSSKHELLLPQKQICSIVAESDLLLSLNQSITQQSLQLHESHSVDWQETTDDAVVLKLDNNCLKAKLLIIADGAVSSLCHQLKCYSIRQNYSQEALVATLTAPALDESTAFQWFNKNKTIAFLPLGEHKYALIWSAKHTKPQYTIQELLHILQQKTQCTITAIDHDSIASFPLSAQKRALSSLARTALIGDTLRTIHPLAGQGLNLGINNCQFLEKCTKNRLDVGSNQALAAYARGANDRGKILQWMTHYLYKSECFSNTALSLGNNKLVKNLAVAFANW